MLGGSCFLANRVLAKAIIWERAPMFLPTLVNILAAVCCGSCCLAVFPPEFVSVSSLKAEVCFTSVCPAETSKVCVPYGDDR